MHLVYKGLGAPCCVTRGLWYVWIAPPLNKGMSGIPMAQRIFFHLPESQVNLPGLERLQDSGGGFRKETRPLPGLWSFVW